MSLAPSGQEPAAAVVDSQSSPCTPRLQRAASDALGDASGLPCTSSRDEHSSEAAAGACAHSSGGGCTAAVHARTCLLASAPPLTDAGATGIGGECSCSSVCGAAPGAHACSAENPTPDPAGAKAAESGLTTGTRSLGDLAASPLPAFPFPPSLLTGAAPARASAPGHPSVPGATSTWPSAFASRWAAELADEQPAGSAALGAGAPAASAGAVCSDGGCGCLSATPGGRCPMGSHCAGPPHGSSRPACPAAPPPLAAGSSVGSVSGVCVSSAAGRAGQAGQAGHSTGSRWADELPDDLLRGVLARMPPAHLRVARLVCCGWAAATGRVMSRLQPEALHGGRLAARFPHLRALCLSHCGHRVVAIERCVLPGPVLSWGCEPLYSGGQ